MMALLFVAVVVVLIGVGSFVAAYLYAVNRYMGRKKFWDLLVETIVVAVVLVPAAINVLSNNHQGDLVPYLMAAGLLALIGAPCGLHALYYEIKPISPHRVASIDHAYERAEKGEITQKQRDEIVAGLIAMGDDALEESVAAQKAAEPLRGMISGNQANGQPFDVPEQS